MDEYFVRQRDYLLEISRALTSQLSLNDVLRVTLRSATKMLGGKAGLVALVNGDAFRIRASYGIDPAMLDTFSPLLQEIPLTDPEGFDSPEVGRKMRLVAQTARIGIYEVIALPMKHGTELIGVVFIFRPQGNLFTSNDIRLLQSFADQAAIAVQNARLYEQVATEKRRLNALLLHSADGIMILNPDRSVESVNIALADILGLGPSCQFDKMHHDTLIRWAQREPGPELADAMAEGWPTTEQSVLYVEGELRRFCNHGETLSVGMTYAPLLDERGDLRNIIVNVRDITKFKEAERAKSTFISVISHELKTPVAIIRGYAETLSRDDVQWENGILRSGLDVIMDETEKLADLIEDLLDVSRAEAGRLKLQIADVNLCHLVEQVARRFQTQTHMHDVVVDLPPEPAVIRADERRLDRVLSNLVSNALKYSPNGGTVTLGVQPLEDGVNLYVSDEGVGIAPDQIDLIFDPFYRVDNSSTRETEGVGLGLHIVRHIVNAHGGRIAIDSELGEGTTFTIWLP
ncbi:MAG: GAF domain-containing protein [Chloroflexi bacterium]|nr:GAF domain-containing protein [Chloroflexota bacterium]